ncbi:MAG: BON domain-containing protein [Acidobacteriota bacterium]
MESKSILCAQCGITLRPFMKVCPKCGAEREEATNLALAPPPVTPPVQPVRTDREPSALQEGIYLSPPDTVRRFPRFTSAQLTLIIIGILLILVGAVIAWLLWRQQVREQQLYDQPAQTLASPAPLSSPAEGLPTASPTTLSPDQQAAQTLEEAIKATLMAYNPFGYTRYRYQVVDGVVTLEGEADHQPEKDGAGNVLRLVAGVKKVVNRLTVKSEPGAAPLRINDAEARVLEAALRRHLEEQEQAQSASLDPPAGKGANPAGAGNPEAEREAERLRRELAVLRQRADDLARRQAIEERLRREAEEDLRRREEERLREAERVRVAPAARRELPALRAGSVAWSGIVDGADDILISGNSAEIRHLSGSYPTGVRVSFSTPIPRATVRLAILSANSGGSGGPSRDEIRVAQAPSAENGYTAIVRVDDTRRSGSRRYEFTLRWELDDKQ